MPLSNNHIMLVRSTWLFRHLKFKNLLTGDDFIHSRGMIFLVLFFITKEVVAPLTNDPIISERAMWLFIYLKHQNPSNISDYINGARIVQQFWRSWSWIGLDVSDQIGFEYSCLTGCYSIVT